MSAAKPTGAELRARRLELELSEAEAAELMSDTEWGTSHAHAICDAEERTGACLDAFLAAYAAALDAEESRFAAEPVPPEGVTTRVIDGGGCTYVSINRGCHEDLIATVWHSDALAISIEDEYASPEALEYVAALSRHIAAQHAADDRARKLAAVKAAEEAVREMFRVHGELVTKQREAVGRSLAALNAAREALAAARKEAGL